MENPIAQHRIPRHLPWRAWLRYRGSVRELLPLSELPVPHRVRPSGHGRPVLDYLLETFPALAEADVLQAISEGRVRLAEGPGLDAGSLLEKGQVLLTRIPVAVAEDPFLPTPEGPLHLVWLDEQMVVVDKPAGLLSCPAGPRMVCALTILERQLQSMGEQWELRPAHRLDRETSGLLAMTRGLQADRRIKEAFARGRVRKTYLAIVRGWMSGPTVVDAPIGHDDAGPVRVRMAVRPDGKEAVTDFTPLGRFGDESRGWTWVEARPRTGRTHQIRLHLAEIGHPVVGDKIYCDSGIGFLRWWDGELDESDLARLELPRHALHAWSMVVPHPATGADLDLRAPVPADLLAFAMQRGGSEPERRD